VLGSGHEASTHVAAGRMARTRPDGRVHRFDRSGAAGGRCGSRAPG
jgi:hypothetical protein